MRIAGVTEPATCSGLLKRRPILSDSLPLNQMLRIAFLAKNDTCAGDDIYGHGGGILYMYVSSPKPPFRRMNDDGPARDHAVRITLHDNLNFHMASQHI